MSAAMVDGREQEIFLNSKEIFFLLQWKLLPETPDRSRYIYTREAHAFLSLSHSLTLSLYQCSLSQNPPILVRNRFYSSFAR